MTLPAPGTGWPQPVDVAPGHDGHRVALRDAVACMAGGAAAVAPPDAPTTSGRPEQTARWLAVAGHVLDFDDTFTPGLAHLSCPTAAAALAVACHIDADVAAVAAGHRQGWEFMAAMTRAHHPALYDRGWHPTAVCGAPAAAVAAATVLGVDRDALPHAVRLAALGAGGLQAAFGSDGKSLQVGLAAQTGVTAALMARAGVCLSGRIDQDWARAHGSVSSAGPMRQDAVEENWIKAYPCCLQTHTAIEAAQELSRSGGSAGSPIRVTVHPISRRAAPLDAVSTPLETKFSIPYLTAFVLSRGRAPDLSDFTSVAPDVAALVPSVTVVVDPDLPQSTAVLRADGVEVRSDAALGSPARPMSTAAHDAKVEALRAGGVVSLLEQPGTPATTVVAALTACVPAGG